MYSSNKFDINISLLFTWFLKHSNTTSRLLNNHTDTLKIPGKWNSMCNSDNLIGKCNVCTLKTLNWTCLHLYIEWNT